MTDTADHLRIVGWNCSGGLAKKTEHLLALKPDIAIISECARAFTDLGALRQVGWTGDYPTKGLGVFARPELGGRVVDLDTTRQWFMPVQFDAIGFGVLAVWAMNADGKEDRPPYGRTHAALAHHAAFVADADLVIGDFNDNVRWDKKRKPSFATTTRMLSDAGYVNLYYLMTGEMPGSESVGTISFRRDVTKPYLIDHAFLRRSRVAELDRFNVEAASDWLHESDHVPLVLDLRRDPLVSYLNGGADGLDDR